MNETEILNQTIAELGANYNTSDEAVLKSIYNDIVTIAIATSNTDLFNMELIPYVKKAVKSEYLARGAEGLNSRSEGSISAIYKDITEQLRNDIIRGGLRRCY